MATRVLHSWSLLLHRLLNMVAACEFAVALLCAALLLTSDAGISNIGVNYGDLGDNLPAPSEVVKLLKAASIDRIKLYDADDNVLAALSNSGIEAVVGVTNQEILRLSSPSLAREWVADKVIKHMPGTKFRYISVGHEVFTSGDEQVASLLLPAMQNLHNALVSFRIDDQVKVTTPHSLGVLSVSFPPSSGTFKPSLAESSLKPLLTFLSQTRAPVMVNAYPYVAIKSAPNDIPLQYALFMANNGIPDTRTGLVYTNLLSAQLDAVNFALEKLGFRNLQLVVSETGWPAVGDVGEQGATVQHASAYNKNLISYVSSGFGTPARPRQPIETYIFSMFNENLKPGPASERNFGIFRPDGSLPYDIGLMKTEVNAGGNNSSGSSPITGSPPAPVAPVVSTPPLPSDGGNQGPGSIGSNGNSPGPVWCVAKPNADPSSLLKALNYACGDGDADCSAVQFGAPCFFPNDLPSHASYAFNNYFVKNGGNKWNCYFGNTAMITLSDPSYGVCIYPPK